MTPSRDVAAGGGCVGGAGAGPGTAPASGVRPGRDLGDNGRHVLRRGPTVVPPIARAIMAPDRHRPRARPADRAVILASNHLSFVDSDGDPDAGAAQGGLPGQVRLLRRPRDQGRARRAWFESLGMLPVDRDDTKAAIDSLDTALEVLGRGEAFGIYPEGTGPRRAAVPRPYGRGAPGVDRRCAGRAGRAARAPRTSSRSARACRVRRR